MSVVYRCFKLVILFYNVNVTVHLRMQDMLIYHNSNIACIYRVSSFWTNHTLLDHVTTVEQWPIDKTSNTTKLEDIYCAYVILEGQVDKNIVGWMSDFCPNSSRSFLCEKESGILYFNVLNMV